MQSRSGGSKLSDSVPSVLFSRSTDAALGFPDQEAIGRYHEEEPSPGDQGEILSAVRDGERSSAIRGGGRPQGQRRGGRGLTWGAKERPGGLERRRGMQRYPMRETDCFQWLKVRNKWPHRARQRLRAPRETRKLPHGHVERSPQGTKSKTGQRWEPARPLPPTLS